jgi:predicted ATPase
MADRPQTPRRSCGCDDRQALHDGRCIALTGGPGAGKTAVLEVVRQHFCDHVVALPEAASIVFGGGFPRHDDAGARKHAQLAIFHVQDQMEKLEAELGQAALVLCDRGIPDGLAYWPGTGDEYWSAIGEPREVVHARYHAVIELRTPSAERGYDHRNPVRIETAEQAARVDERIARAWAGHPRRFEIASTDRFLDKLDATLAILESLVPPCCRAHFRDIEASTQVAR